MYDNFSTIYLILADVFIFPLSGSGDKYGLSVSNTTLSILIFSVHLLKKKIKSGYSIESYPSLPGATRFTSDFIIPKSRIEKRIPYSFIFESSS